MHQPCAVGVDAVLFDLDGVLVDSTATVERHWREFAARHALDASDLLRGLHGRRMVDIIAGALPTLTPSELAVEAAWMESREAAGAASGTLALPGALELTKALAGRSWAIVTSGTAPVANARIAAVGLPRPPVFVTGEDVERGKPDPSPYLLAAARLGVRPQDCLVVEDAPAGLAAGVAAGAVTIGVATSHPAAELGVADHLVDSPLALRVEGSGPISLSIDCSRHGG